MDEWLRVSKASHTGNGHDLSNHSRRLRLERRPAQILNRHPLSQTVVNFVFCAPVSRNNRPSPKTRMPFVS
jgi:hypothetical protein